MKQEEISILDTQILASFLTAVTVGVSILLLYNQELIIQGKKPIFDEEIALKISLINRIMIVFIIILFISSNVQYLDFDIRRQKNTDLDYWQILAGLLTLGAGLVAVYIAYKSAEEDTTGINVINGIFI